MTPSIHRIVCLRRTAPDARLRRQAFLPAQYRKSMAIVIKLFGLDN